MAPSTRPTSSNQRKRTANPRKADAGLDGIMALAAAINAQHQQMAIAFAPVVQHLIHSRCQDAQQIEQTLDRLLDCACISEGLALFKSLCRYYYNINPASTCYYVHAYREMWDSEVDQEQETTP